MRRKVETPKCCDQGLRPYTDASPSRLDSSGDNPAWPPGAAGEAGRPGSGYASREFLGRTWQSTSAMTTSRSLPLAVLLQSGQVLVARGNRIGTNGMALTGAEFYQS
jgi:hypothetical protein